MTCIVAIAENGTVTMGGDSAAVSESTWGMSTCAEPKVWQHGPVLLGECGSFRVAQLIRHNMTLPGFDADDDPLKYLVGPFTLAVRSVLAEGGALTTWDETGTEELTYSGLLVGLTGRVFEVYEDFGIGELAEGYGAVGCGAELALGAVVATENLNLKSKRRVRLALEAADRHSAGVRGPFTILRSAA